MIVGGESLSPYGPANRSLVAIARRDQNTIYCSGTLIAPKLVLTAAHCLDGMPNSFDVLFGHNIDDALRIQATKAMVFSPPNTRFYPNFDVGWLALDKEPPPPYRPAEILRDPAQLSPLLAGKVPLILAGFGKTSTECDEHRSRCVGEAREVSTRLRRYVNTPHFRQLLLTGPTPGQGSCQGDSGGPAYAEIKGRWYLAGFLHGKNLLLNSKQILKTEQLCESGESTYTFAAAYREWIEKTAEVKLPVNELANPPAPPPPPAAMLGNAPSLAEYLAYDKPESPLWKTADVLISSFKDPGKRIDPNFDELVTDPIRAAATMEKWETLSSYGVTATLPTLIPRDQQITDLRPLALLRNLKTLELSDHRIQDTSPLKQLTGLEKLTLNTNYDFATKRRIPWNLAFLEYLPRLRVLNLLANGQAAYLKEIPWDSLTGLETLVLSSESGDLDLSAIPWSKLVGLKQLIINNCGLGDITPLADAVNLEQLNLQRNAIRDIAVLKKLKNLRILDVSDNQIQDFGPVIHFNGLEQLYATDNPSVSFPCPARASCEYRSQ